MECQRLVKRIRYLEVGCLACSDVPNLEVLKKKAKKAKAGNLEKS